MRHVGLISAVVGLLLAVSAPARAESAGHASDAKAKMETETHKDCTAKTEAQQDRAAKDQAKASPAGKSATAPSDTLVVPASGDQPGFTMVGENVTYTDPSFVPYKLREAARRARASVDISTIP